VLNVLTVPNIKLNQVCSKVARFDFGLQELVNQMFLTMKVSKGIGLAAPQVGILKQLFVVEVDNVKLVCVNPRVSLTGDEFDSEEACLSIPDVTVVVKRKREVIVDAFDEFGNRFQNSFTGILAVVIQHENDHLNGVLITDK
jgi:peptide deformylase